MRAVERRPAKGSLRWLREAVSARSAMSGVLDERIRQACGLPARAEIKWRSPLEEDDYAELRGRHPLYRYVHEVFIDVAKHNSAV